MAERQQIAFFPTLPPAPPGSPPWFVSWVSTYNRAVNRSYGLLARRLEEIILQGATAERPTADGSRRFFFDTSTNTLYYDDGAWNAI